MMISYLHVLDIVNARLVQMPDSVVRQSNY
jgi:hypothetical protein